MPILSIVIALLGLGILAAIHEIGHFFAAQWLGIKAEELSIFVGPALFTWKRKGVVYNIRLIPFGAYVRYVGMDVDENGEIDTSDPDCYLNQPRWKRLLVSLAGPFMNLLLGVVIFFAFFSATGFTTTNIQAPPPNSQLAATAVQEGDQLISINGSRIFTSTDASFILQQTDFSKVNKMVLRNHETGETYEAVLTPTLYQRYRLNISVNANYLGEGWEILQVDPKQNNGNPVLKEKDIVLSINGISVDDPAYKNVLDSGNDGRLTLEIRRDGKEQTVEMQATLVEVPNDLGLDFLSGSGLVGTTRQAFLYPLSIFRVSIAGLQQAFSGAVPVNEIVTGPVGIVSMVSQQVDRSDIDNSVKIQNLVVMAGIISVALAFSNMLPLPGLDGNALVLISVEMIRGKRISTKTESIINLIGFVILIALVIFALYSDISKLV